MDIQRVIILGGCGFVGSNLAMMLAEHHPELTITAVDNLMRRGSEFNVDRIRSQGVEFIHADLRSSHDLDRLGASDLVIDCAAEPSVAAGSTGSPRMVLDTNLSGTINALEYARQNDAAFLFLSTSRVFPIEAINDLPFDESETRFNWTALESTPGCRAEGITEQFPIEGVRSFYGTSKLACEYLIAEYANAYGLRALVNRCGLLSGPWQFGKTDQGVISLWVARHFFGLPLQYIGYGGTGKQVRDVLHVADLYQLVEKQLAAPAEVWDGRVYNVGGGLSCSTSLLELTQTCQTITGRSIPIAAVPQTSKFDLRLFLMDSSNAQREFGWKPKFGVEDIVIGIHEWLAANESLLRPLFCT